MKSIDDDDKKFNINHIQSVTDYRKVEVIYSEKDGVDVKYVCTTDLNGGINPADIFYRETPHPQYGNRYFGIYSIDHIPYIFNADKIEDLEFGMIMCVGEWVYSSHRHDYIACDGRVIDGGRAYTRGNGYTMFVVKDGEFELMEDMADDNMEP